MMKVLFILILTLSPLRMLTIHNKYRHERQEIYSLALNYTTGSDTIYRYHLGIPPFPNKDTKHSNKQIKKYEEKRTRRKLVLNTGKIFVIVNQEIDTLNNRNIGNILASISSNRNKPYPFRKDTSFNAALRDLCNNKLRFDSIRVASLKTRFNYRILSDRYYQKHKEKYRSTSITVVDSSGNYHGSWIFGKVGFSKIGFTKDHEKAVVYSMFICGNLCGHGQILFFKKINGTWKYVKIWRMWVA